MAKLKQPYCVGCGKTVSELPEYDKENPVQEDGTYKNNKFVCTACYTQLIPLGLDVGTPEVIQERMINLHNHQHPNFLSKKGNLYLVRCYNCDPKYGRENWAPAVSSGQCAWCGWKEKE